MGNTAEVKKTIMPLSIPVISLIAAFSSFVVVFFLSGYSSLYFAYDFDITAYTGLSGTVFQTPANDPKWTFDALMTLHMSQPLTSFFIGLTALTALVLNHKKSLTWWYFFIWTSIWGINGAVGLLLDDAIFGIGTYKVAKAMDFSTPVFVVIGLISTYFLFLVGKLICQLYCLPFRKAPFFQQKTRNILLAKTIILPWIFITLINYPTWFPTFSSAELFKNLTAIILITPFFIKRPAPPTEVALKSWTPPNLYDVTYCLLLLLLSGSLIFILAKTFSIAN